MKTLSWSAGIALLSVAICAPSAEAVTLKCQRTIAKASSQFVQAKSKALSKCEEAIVKGSITGPCPDTKTSDKIQKAIDKLHSSIGKTCGGDDKACGGILTNEDTPLSLGWPATCPNFESGNCTNAITDCDGIATCLECMGEAAVDQAIDLYYDSLAPHGGDKALIKCQTTIGKATTAFLASKTKALQKCWDARMNGKHGLTCVPGSAGDTKYLAAIQKAEDKKDAAICKACGGSDKVCGGVGDFTAAQIGFPAICPYVTTPTTPAAACGTTITNLQSIVDCVDCVTEFKADCVDQATVPQFVPLYPSDCNVECTQPPPTGPCPTQFEFTADGPNVDLDTGFTGLAQDARVPTNGRLTLSVSGCAGVSQPGCAQCNVSGPNPNGGGPAFGNRRCKDKSWITCSANADCTSATACFGGGNTGALCTVASECPGGACNNAASTGPCIYYFGAPLPLVAGGVSTCVINQLTAGVTGTVNIDDGTSTTLVPLASNVHPTGTVFAPCPRCVAGKCSPAGAARDGQNCTVQGTGVFGDVSLDCPPDPGASAGILTINLQISTGTQTRTLTALQPNCTQTGYTGLKCFCSTCNNLAQEACTENADCPISGLNPGICGGRRCIGGTNAGAPCSNTTECPGGGSCGRPGEATQPNVCQDDSLTPMTDESLCADIGGNEGECPFGPVDSICSIQRQIACTTNADCAPSMSCADCLPGQECVTVKRPCFTDNGSLGGTVNVAGSADEPCGGIANPTVGSFFCVAPVAAPAVNAAGGLPALGRVLIPGTAVITP